MQNEEDGLRKPMWFTTKEVLETRLTILSAHLERLLDAHLNSVDLVENLIDQVLYIDGQISKVRKVLSMYKEKRDN